MRPDLEPGTAKSVARVKEMSLQKMIKELQMLHVGDPDYQEQDFLDDMKYRCERSGIDWDEEKAMKLLKKKPE
jgi:hypothetical protein